MGYGHSLFHLSAGGSLLLADGGVCVIGNLSASGKDTREILQKGV